MAKKDTSAKTNVKAQSTIDIIGDNILYNNGVITAFYIIPLSNYSTNSPAGVHNTVQQITNMIANLTTNNPTVQFTIERIEKTIRRKDVLENLYNTIKIYREDYDMPPEFTRNVRDDLQSYCMLGIDIQQTTVTDVEEFTLLDTAKAIAKNMANSFAGLGNLKADPEKIMKIEENIYRTINYKCVRASKELVFYNFVSKVFPCYEISYDRLSYISEKTYTSIMGAVTQTVSDNFGWFEMHNEGMDIFGLDPQTTYGCMLDIQAFPPQISTCNFPMDYPNVVTTIQCLKKEDAMLKLKRTRASDRYERDQAIEAGAELESIEETQSNIDIATMAIQDLEQGTVLCQFNCSVLVYAETKNELKQRVMNLITECKDRNILVSKSLTQALDFLDNYINKKPKKFLHTGPLMFPLSFQQNSGATVGDTEGLSTAKGDPIWSPSIGEDL